MFRPLSVVVLVLIVLAISLSSPAVQAAEGQSEADPKVVIKVYKVGHLTSYSEDRSNWDFAKLIDRFQSQLGDDETTTFAPYPQNLSLVISATQANHNIIAKVIAREEQKLKQAEPDKKKVIVTVVYRVGDLPAFTQGKSHWDPLILLELLKAKTGNDDSITFAPYPQNLSLIISATNEQHKLIRAALRQLRGQDLPRQK